MWLLILLAVLDQSSYRSLLGYALANSATSAKEYEGSLGSDLLEFAKARLRPLDEQDVFQSGGVYERFLTMATYGPVVLSRLASSEFSNQTGLTQSPITLTRPKRYSVSYASPPPQRKKHRASISTTGPSVFQHIGKETPSSQADVHSLESEVLCSLKDATRVRVFAVHERNSPQIQEYLALMRSGPVSQAIVDQLNQRLKAQSSGCGRVILTSGEETQVSLTMTSQSLKVALYLDAAENFGDWRIFIGSRCIKSLREYYKRDRKIFDIIIKKMQYVQPSKFGRALNG